jgi:hypothetical protein
MLSFKLAFIRRYHFRLAFTIVAFGRKSVLFFITLSTFGWQSRGHR